LLDAIRQPFGPYFRLELPNGPQHMEQQTLRGTPGIDMLIEYLRVELVRASSSAI
jgi:hypothetical protein